MVKSEDTRKADILKYQNLSGKIFSLLSLEIILFEVDFPQTNSTLYDASRYALEDFKST